MNARTTPITVMEINREILSEMLGNADVLEEAKSSSYSRQTLVL